jgi:tol-pal system-associated acyl-CoA thioesterase
VPRILRRSASFPLSVPGQPFTWTVRVYYEDTDTGGVVYYANYLKFFERARTEWLRAAGFEQQALAREHGLQFVVARIECDYRRPARLDDIIELDVRVAQAGRASSSSSRPRGAALKCSPRPGCGRDASTRAACAEVRCRRRCSKP